MKSRKDGGQCPSFFYFKNEIMNKVRIKIPTPDNKPGEAEFFQVEDEMLKKAGILIPVLICEKVWTRYVEVPNGLTGFRDLNGRLWDMLFMFNIKASMAGVRTFQFSYLCELPGGWDICTNETSCHASTIQRTVTLEASLVEGGSKTEPPMVLINLPDD